MEVQVLSWAPNQTAPEGAVCFSPNRGRPPGGWREFPVAANPNHSGLEVQVLSWAPYEETPDSGGLFVWRRREGVLQGVEYLKRLNLGKTVPQGKKVVVIGGGNVAVDVARSAVRKGAEQVTILYRRTRREMPAYHHEIEEALEEGIMPFPAAILSGI